MDSGIWIDSLKLDLFHAMSHFALREDFLCSVTDTRMSVIDVVVEYSISLVVAVRNSMSMSAISECIPLKEGFDPASTNLSDILN